MLCLYGNITAACLHACPHQQEMADRDNEVKTDAEDTDELLYTGLSFFFISSILYQLDLSYSQEFAPILDDPFVCNHRSQ